MPAINEVLAVSLLLAAVYTSVASPDVLQADSSVPSCFWIEAQKACVPSYQNMLAVSGATPSNVFRKAYLMALDRSDLCSKSYSSEAKCMADTANRCFWRHLDKGGICLNADYAEARTCSANSNNQSACQKNSECIYNAQSKTCLKAQVAQPGKDAYDDKLAAIMTGCAKLTTKTSCTGKTVKLDQAGKWAAWKAPSAQTNCPSPLL